MKWTLRIALIFSFVCLVYAGTAIHSILAIVRAAKAGDSAEIVARTDISGVRRAMVDQLMEAYLKTQDSRRRLTPFLRMAINAYGVAIADDLVRKIMTQENVDALLRFGKSKGPKETGIDGFPPLAQVDTSDMLQLFGRIRPVKPVELFVRLGDPEQDAGISFHFQNSSWKISSLRLPKSAVEKLVGRLPSP